MEYKDLDKEYYIMSVDGANNHPLLNWGSTRKAPFLKPQPINMDELNLPLKIVFAQPYPKTYETPDLWMLTAQFAGSEKLKNIFERLNIYGAQFVPIEIESNKGEIITGQYAIHFWNRIPAIDKDNYDGEAPDGFGDIIILNKFSLDEKVLSAISIEQRQVFILAENPTKILIHKNTHDQLIKEGLVGCRFFRVDEWDTGATFR